MKGQYWDSIVKSINESGRKVKKSVRTYKAKRNAKKKINKSLDVLIREINRIDKKEYEA